MTSEAATASTVENRYMPASASSRAGSPRRTTGSGAPARSVYTGSRAEQLVSGDASMVTSQSRCRGRVRVAR